MSDNSSDPDGVKHDPPEQDLGPVSVCSAPMGSRAVLSTATTLGVSMASVLVPEWKVWLRARS